MALPGVAALLGCKMESLINDLRHQYAASATAAVSQAMLLQALDQSRQVASHISSRQTSKISSGASQSLGEAQVNHNPIQSDQQTPLDLSVRPPNQQAAYQATRSRSQSRQLKQQMQQQQALDSLETSTTNRTAPVTQQRSVHQETNDSSEIDNYRRPAPSNQLKLITSSTSPTSSGSSSTSSLSSSSATNYQRGLATISTNSPQPARFPLDANNNQLEQVAPASLPGPYAHHDVISSTNGRRQRRGQTSKAAGKKQKGTKSHLCNYCGRSFSRSDMLTRHSRLHSGLKPYQCGKCYQVFSRSDHLSTHERTHTGEKPYQCGHCDYSACRRDMITRHTRTHMVNQGSDSGTRVKTRRKRRRKSNNPLGDKFRKESKSQLNEDDVSTSFEISVTDS